MSGNLACLTQDSLPAEYELLLAYLVVIRLASNSTLYSFVLL